MKKPVIGFIGQGFIGGSYSDDFERRGYEVIRYDLSKKYKKNKNKLKNVDIVFVAVPTPNTPEKGFDSSILEDAIRNGTHKGQTVVIKSTIKVGTTGLMQDKFKDRFIIHSPEFLTESTAKYDAANPDRNILGYSSKSKNKCQAVMNILPVAPYEAIVPAKEAEFVKYAGNIWFYIKVITANLLYDVSSKYEIDYDNIKDMLSADKRVGRTHLDVIHKSGVDKKNKIGRGAGGHCFIKDMEAFREMYMSEYDYGEKLSKIVADDHSVKIDDMTSNMHGFNLLANIVEYNKKLLKDSGKDLDLLKGVYGEL